MTTAEDKSIYGQIKTKGEQLVELVKRAEDIQNNNDKNAAEAYQKGLEDGKKSIDKGCEGCRYVLRFASDEPCKDCSNCYTSKYEPMPKDEICFGDEIVVDGERGVVVSRENEESDTIWALFNGYRTPQIVAKNNYAKTGRHFGIEEIMEAMRK